MIGKTMRETPPKHLAAKTESVLAGEETETAPNKTPISRYNGQHNLQSLQAEEEETKPRLHRTAPRYVEQNHSYNLQQDFFPCPVVLISTT